VRRQILVVGFLMLLATQCAAQQKSAVSEVPFTFQNGLVVVEATIKNNNTPVRVVLATGAEFSMADPLLFKKYELPFYYAADGPVTGRNDKTFSFTTVSNVRVGGSKSKNLNMRLGSISAVSNVVGQEIFAALGSDFFEGQIVQIDFKNKVIRFMDKAPDNPTSDKSIVLRMAPKPDDPFRKTFLVPVVKEVQFNGQKQNLLIDTGVASSIAFSSGAAKKVGFTPPTENSREDKVTLRFESQELTEVPSSIYAKGTSSDEKLSKHGVVAGSLFLQNFVVLFDYKKGVVVLERL